MNNTLKYLFFLLIVVLSILTSCASGPTTDQAAAMERAQEKAAQNHVYEMKNNIELRNYNWRQETSDDPTTILWCTTSFPNPSSPIFTVPIAGKLTSSSKRPYPTSQVSSDLHYYPELAGPDNMYGSSGEYRYGFGPGGKSQYYDFYNMSTFCTTVPKTWMREKTEIVAQTDQELFSAQKKIQDILAKADALSQQAEAQMVCTDQQDPSTCTDTDQSIKTRSQAQEYMDQAQTLLETSIRDAGGK